MMQDVGDETCRSGRREEVSARRLPKPSDGGTERRGEEGRDQRCGAEAEEKRRIAVGKRVKAFREGEEAHAVGEHKQAMIAQAHPG